MFFGKEVRILLKWQAKDAYLELKKRKEDNLSIYVIMLYSKENAHITALRNLNDPQILLINAPRIRSIKNISFCLLL